MFFSWAKRLSVSHLGMSRKMQLWVDSSILCASSRPDLVSGGFAVTVCISDLLCTQKGLLWALAQGRSNPEGAANQTY